MIIFINQTLPSPLPSHHHANTQKYLPDPLHSVRSMVLDQRVIEYYESRR
jgi:hypothetical protein